MKFKRLSVCVLASGLVMVACRQARAAIIGGWDFDSLAVGTNNNPPASINNSGGTPTATQLGMTNNYTYSTSPPTTGSTANSDILLDAGSDGGSSEGTTGNIWRIRGGGAPNTAGNGWNNAAPQYSQGAEFDVSTAGYTGIGLTFDWYGTSKGVRDLQPQYTIDGINWTNVGPLLVAIPNGWENQNTISFAGNTAVENNPLFGVRLVSAYDPTYTGAGAPTYTSATLTAGQPVQYNNNSGNWRFDAVNVTGTVSAVPEPSSILMLAMGGCGLAFAGFRRRPPSRRALQTSREAHAVL